VGSTVTSPVLAVRFIVGACLLAACALGFVALARAADEITATVTAVTSGDTLQVADGQRTLEVRLADIGAPHGSDFYAPAAQALLNAMVSGQSVRVAITGRSGTDRVFGRVFARGLDINLELVRRGAAWMCIEYAIDTDYLPFQREAQRRQVGLWASANTNDFDARNRCRQRPPAEHPVGRP
jgi:endonuclease YncB( thermonuclease family)